MEKKLVSNQLENKYAFNKYARTIDYLNQAANIFDKAGMHQEANEITKVLNSFTKILKNKR
jgi:pterin-4a-carbinolamine dehydratase